MQINNKFRIFGIIVGVLMLGGLVGVMALTVQRAQQLQSTIGRPKAAGGCTGTGSVEVGNCGGFGKCSGDFSCGGGHYNPMVKGVSGGFNWDECKSSFGDYICTRNVSESRCITSKKINCSTKTDQSSCQAVSGCSWGGGSSGYTASSPIGGITVSSLTPTLVWTVGLTGLTYQNAYITTNSQCGYEAAPVQWFDHVPFGTNQVTANTLQPNTTYYWNVYAQPGMPAPGTGCQSFRTPAAAPPPPECTTDSACAADKKCESNKCVAISCTTTDVCKTATIANHACTIANKADRTTCETGGKSCQSGVCTAPSCPIGQTMCGTVCKNLQTDNSNCGACGTVCTTDKSCISAVCTSNEVNACWGNLGTGTNAGRCYDCNGDGVINILDFSCFAKRWREKVE